MQSEEAEVRGDAPASVSATPQINSTFSPASLPLTLLSTLLSRFCFLCAAFHHRVHPVANLACLARANPAESSPRQPASSPPWRATPLQRPHSRPLHPTTRLNPSKSLLLLLPPTKRHPTLSAATTTAARAIRPTPEMIPLPTTKTSPSPRPRRRTSSDASTGTCSRTFPSCTS